MKAQDYLNKKPQEMGAMPSDRPTPPNTPDARAAEIAQSNPIGGALDIGKNMLEIGEMFGIDRSTVGKMLLKGVLTGKFDLPGMKAETNSKRKKLEVAVDQGIKLAWTFFAIFMIFKIFTVVVGIIT